MIFEVFPILDMMIDFYQKHRSFDRFKDYLKMLQGDTKDDLALPIGGFNPMAKEHALQKLLELNELHAEKLIQETLKELNNELIDIKKNAVFKVVLNLSDDFKGGWTNFYTSDYDSKFKLNGLINRNFCTPIFWASEDFDEEKIINRTLEYCHRTTSWLSNPKPKTLKDHILQEQLVSMKVKLSHETDIDFKQLWDFFLKFKETTEHVTIFNFLYGDNASASLGNKTLGIKEEFAGYKFARYLANKGIKI